MPIQNVVSKILTQLFFQLQGFMNIYETYHYNLRLFWRRHIVV